MRKEVEHTTRVKGVFDPDDFLEMIGSRLTGKITELRVWVKVPGGGDYSNMDLENPEVHFSCKLEDDG